MFVLGHLGIGKKLASPWSKRLPRAPLFLGMLLPDIIDKALYYLAPPIGLITCTRTFGHTGVLLFTVLLIAWAFRSRALAALSLGMATHLLLDCLMDRFDPSGPGSALIALTWPFFHFHFAAVQFDGVGDHLRRLLNFPILSAEALGLSFLGWDYWKTTNRRAVFKALRPKTH